MAIEVPSLRKPEPNIGQRGRIIPLQMELRNTMEKKRLP